MKLAVRIILILLLAGVVSACGSGSVSTISDGPDAVRSAVVQWFTAIHEENVGAICSLTEGVSGGNTVERTCAAYYRSSYFTPAQQESFDGGWPVPRLLDAAHQLTLKNVMMNGTRATLTMPPSSLGQYNTSAIDLVYLNGSWKILEYGVAGGYRLPCRGSFC